MFGNDRFQLNYTVLIWLEFCGIKVSIIRSCPFVEISGIPFVVSNCNRIITVLSVGNGDCHMLLYSLIINWATIIFWPRPPYYYSYYWLCTSMKSEIREDRHRKCRSASENLNWPRLAPLFSVLEPPLRLQTCIRPERASGDAFQPSIFRWEVPSRQRPPIAGIIHMCWSALSSMPVFIALFWLYRFLCDLQRTCVIWRILQLTLPVYLRSKITLGSLFSRWVIHNNVYLFNT